MGRQGIVSAIGDEYSEQLGRFSIACIVTDQMMCSRCLIPAFARAVDAFGLTLYLARDLTRDECVPDAGAIEKTPKASPSIQTADSITVGRLFRPNHVLIHVPFPPS
jgi:hypothetical protein